jgi:hypothetical protein
MKNISGFLASWKVEVRVFLRTGLLLNVVGGKNLNVRKEYLITG